MGRREAGEDKGLDDPKVREARSQAILDCSLDAIICMDQRGLIAEFNPAAERIFGHQRADAIGKPLADLIIPERLREQHRLGLERYLANGHGPVVNRRVEMPALRADGTEFPAELAIVPVAGGDSPAFLGFLRDISERKRAERRQKFLMDELAHRSRNLLTVVGSLIARGLSGETASAEARQVLMRRIEALGRSQSVLVSGGLDGASLGEIVQLEIEAFSEKVSAEGPDVILSPKAAQTFALLVHELATNAVKHGALSSPNGRIDVEWRLEGDGDGARFAFRWRERGGPAVAAPVRTGFGRLLLEQAITSDFEAIPTLSFAREGFSYEFNAPFNRLLSGARHEDWRSLK